MERFKTPKQRTGRIFLTLVCFLGLVCCLAIGNSPAAAEAVKKLAVISSSFKEGASVPKRYSGDGYDMSPALSWSLGPANTKSYAISCEDPDAPGGTWWHWILYNISPKTQQLGEKVPKVEKLADGVAQGLNDFGKPGYNGPAPPAGKLHHYNFKVMALDTTLPVKAGFTKENFKAAIKDHVLAEGQLTGVYQR